MIKKLSRAGDPYPALLLYFNNRSRSHRDQPGIADIRSYRLDNN